MKSMVSISGIQENSRCRWLMLNTAEELSNDGQEVIEGLSQSPKTLPCRYFYDDFGSALFEQICDLPEYYPTRTEQSILESCASEIAQLTGACELIELGSGSSRKTRLLLDAYSQLNSPLRYCPIDVSTGILKTSALDLLQEYQTLHICGVAGTYEQALAQLPTPDLNPRLLIFLGSTLGNLEEQECTQFLAQIRQALQPGEYFLVGVDLQKAPEVLETAYNDSKGVTAAFNLNMLRHVNRTFQGNFALDQFVHRAFYNAIAHQIEMHLVSLQAQTVTLESLKFQVTLQAGESLRTEISRKFHLPTFSAVLAAQGLRSLRIWTDPQDWFALLLCQSV
jgi:dimethylhistidine N-methyltransferase